MGSSAHALAVGTVFAREFRIVRILGEGGMGAVYVAEQLGTGKLRALKTMHPQLVSNPALRERFVQEARIGARIDSEHVVDVVAAGVDTATGMPWLAMELLQGETLGAFVERGVATPNSEVLLQLGNALASAHAAGVVHRDLKPENIFLARTRHHDVPFVLKVLDFGIAKLLRRGSACITASVGTPLWMAPEQTEVGAAVSPATDVWAFGLIAFYVITGRSYWHLVVDGAEVSAPVLLRQIVIDSLPRASDRARELGVATTLPPGFDAWFARCVNRDPRQRFANGAEALAALRPLLGRPAPPLASPVAATVAVRCALPSVPTMSGIASTRSPVMPERLSGRALVAIVATLFAIAVLTGAGVMIRAERQARAMPTEEAQGSGLRLLETEGAGARTPIALVAPKNGAAFASTPVQLEWSPSDAPDDEYTIEVECTTCSGGPATLSRTLPAATAYALWPWSGTPQPGVYRWSVASKRRAVSRGEFAFYPSMLDRVKQTGKLRVSLEATQHPPFVYVDKAGRMSGFDVDLAEAIAEDMGVELTRQPRAWEQLFRDVESRDADIVLSAVTITPERARRVTFSTPYVQTGVVVTTRAGTPRIQAPGRGLRLGAQRSTTGASVLGARFHDASARELDTLDAAFVGLAQGELDGLVADAAIVAARDEVKSGRFRIQSPPLTKDGYGVMMPPGDEPLRERVNLALAALEASGKLLTLRQKYGVPSN
ncbi:MAG: transporter substrate-binding domain-containing protein [Deltaproteobacteria bacterium]|nr:transporter substrate-binding domain-containing protein [Deltaproteobacteria bacterium]